MGHNDHIDFELSDLIAELVDSGELEKDSAAHGIAQQVIHDGYNSLSSKQKFIYDKTIRPALQKLTEEHRMLQIINRASK